MSRAEPAAALRPYVREYIGWFEHTAQPLVRREVPSDVIPIIINFGAPVRIFDTAERSAYRDFDAFTTGVYDTYVLVRTSGPSGGLQINLTIPGARVLLGLPLGELVNRAIALDDLLGADARRLASELNDAPDWSRRFDITDRALTARLGRGARPSREVMWASRRLLETRGSVPIAVVVEEIGCSPKHLAAKFRSEIGLTPKRLARVLRFGRAIEQIKRGEARLSELALSCGYYDQAHFDRDFKAFAGLTPTELIASLLPASGGFAADR